MIQLGQKVRDRVTGFEGIVVNKVEYLNGCIQFCVKPRCGEDGKMSAGEYIDDAQLEVVDDDGIIVDVSADGGAMPDSPPVQYGG